MLSGLQIIIALLLTVAILIQSEGSGLSSIVGGNQFYSTKRGVEKIVFIGTIILAVSFVINSFFLYIS